MHGVSKIVGILRDLSLSHAKKKIKKNLSYLDFMRKHLTGVLLEATLKMHRYFIAKGLRFVNPYYHEYIANARLRWFGRSCFEVYSSEFKNLPSDHYYREIMDGRMKLIKNPNSKKYHKIFEGRQLIRDVKIDPGDKIIHREHVHEPPVSANLPETIYEDQNYIVVNKPAGIPVHPVGTYYYNTLQQILYALRPDIKELYPIHRLDKVTSGVQMFGKNHEATSRFKELIKEGYAQKTYLALVKGMFTSLGEEPVTCKDPVVYIYGSRKSVNQFSPATTVFKSIVYDKEKDESLVECKPLTGFSHQIRIHLRNLGFPIVDDTLYLNKYSAVFRNRNEVTEEYLNTIYDISRMNRAKEECNAEEQKHKCSDCGMILYKNPTLESLSIKLHSWKYSMTDILAHKTYEFKTAPPIWASMKLANAQSNACTQS